MELNEYIDSIYDIDIDDFTDEELDRIDDTVKSVIVQMDWLDRIQWRVDDNITSTS